MVKYHFSRIIHNICTSIFIVAVHNTKICIKKLPRLRIKIKILRSGSHHPPAILNLGLDKCIITLIFVINFTFENVRIHTRIYVSIYIFNIFV